MNFFNSLLLTEIDFYIPNVIQGFVLNLSLYLLLLLKGACLLSENFIALRKLFVDNSTLFSFRFKGLDQSIYQSNPK